MSIRELLGYDDIDVSIASTGAEALSAIEKQSFDCMVLDLRLPEDFHPANAGELIDALLGLSSKLLPYVLSFMVLGMRWLATVQVRTHTESFGSHYIRWWLIYLLLITCVPFTTTIAGRFMHLAPAIWLYSGQTMLVALISFRLLALTPELEKEHNLRSREVGLAMLLLAALVSIAWSFVNPAQALWAFLINFAAPPVTRWSLRVKPMA